MHTRIKAMPGSRPGVNATFQHQHIGITGFHQSRSRQLRQPVVAVTDDDASGLVRQQRRCAHFEHAERQVGFSQQVTVARINPLFAHIEHGQFAAFLIELIGARRYLEIGTFFPGTSLELDPGFLVMANVRVEAVAAYDAASLQRAVGFLDRHVGDLPLDHIVVDYPLEQINEAYAELKKGEVARQVIAF